MPSSILIRRSSTNRTPASRATTRTIKPREPVSEGIARVRKDAEIERASGNASDGDRLPPAYQSWTRRRPRDPLLSVGVEVAALVCIECPRKLSDKVRGMSRRLFPKIGYVISPYTFRHAIAAREKACGRSVGSLAEVLGHVSGRSQRGYGTPQQGRHLPGSICAAGAERPVRNTDLSQWYEPGAAMPAEQAAPVMPGGSGPSAAAQTPTPEPAA
jgi:hypothetical protein